MTYLENIKLRYFADEDELKEIFSKEIMVLDELGLLFLARGLARVEKRKEALIVLEKIKDEDIDLAILQSRSPTCGVNQIYDGNFSGKLIKGKGLFAKALIKNKYKIIDSEDIR